LICQICERLLEAHWVHGHAGYRCRHGHHSTNERSDIPKNVYAREDQALLLLANRLPSLDAESTGGLNHPLIPQILAEHDVVIRCGHYTWQLEVRGELIYDGWPPRPTRVNNGRRRRPKAQSAAP
jgi:hypothetical protein